MFLGTLSRNIMVCHILAEKYFVTAKKREKTSFTVT